MAAKLVSAASYLSKTIDGRRFEARGHILLGPVRRFDAKPAVNDAPASFVLIHRLQLHDSLRPTMVLAVTGTPGSFINQLIANCVTAVLFRRMTDIAGYAYTYT